MVTKEETAKILGVCMDVFHELGSGFLEPVYQDAAEIAFRQAGIPFAREAQCPIYFRGIKIKRNYEADFVCFGEVILEFKAVKSFTPEHKAQLINYLRATRIPLGYLINFHGDRMTWERIVLTPKPIEPQTDADEPSLTLGEDKGATPAQSNKASVSAASSAPVCGSRAGAVGGKPQTDADEPSLTHGEDKGATPAQSNKASVSAASSAKVCG